MTNDLQLSITETEALNAYESIIEKGIQTFFEVGDAFVQIRNDRLYRKAFSTFEEYCRERWKMSKTQANRLIAASTVVSNLAPAGVKPTHESQVRPLTGLDPDEQREAWEEATCVNPNPTAAQVKAAAFVIKNGRRMALPANPQTTDVPIASIGRKAPIEIEIVRVNGSEPPKETEGLLAERGVKLRPILGPGESEELEPIDDIAEDPQFELIRRLNQYIEHADGMNEARRLILEWIELGGLHGEKVDLAMRCARRRKNPANPAV